MRLYVCMFTQRTPGYWFRLKSSKEKKQFKRKKSSGGNRELNLIIQIGARRCNQKARRGQLVKHLEQRMEKSSSQTTQRRKGQIGNRNGKPPKRCLKLRGSRSVQVQRRAGSWIGDGFGCDGEEPQSGTCCKEYAPLFIFACFLRYDI